MQHDKFSGFGCCYYEDGTRFVGEWINDFRVRNSSTRSTNQSVTKVLPSDAARWAMG
jgi:hypothetical protein